jgi:putative DNA primase/helicase
VWEGALARALPDPEIRGFLQRAVGYSLGGPASEKILFVVHGPKDSGKSAIINAIYRMFGSYAVTTRLSTFGIGSEDSGNTPELASLAGARFVLVPEIPAGKAFATGILKQWTGGDPVSATPKYAHPITFQPQGRLWFVGNDRPSIPYEDEAAWERVRVIPFAQTIPEAERDRDFGSRISLDAVLTWAVEGRKTFDRDGLKTPAAVYAARDEYREECDPLGEFLEECCELDPRASTSSADAFDRYMTWCEIRRDKKPLTRRQFSLKMKRQGITPERNMHERLFVGVGLKPSVG